MLQVPRPWRMPEVAMTDPVDSSVRLAKRVAALVPCSRREAEQYIEGGWVRVNGAVVEEPQFRVTDQRVEIDPEASLLALTPVTLLLHKPPGYEAGLGDGARGRTPSALDLLQTTSHWREDSSDTRVLKAHLARLTPTAPLPTPASGLLVFTQDWRIARKLTEDADGTEQEVMVEVAGEVSEEALARLCHGLSFNGRPLPPIKVSISSTSPQQTRLRFASKGVRPGQIPSMCEAVGLRLLAIKRIRLGRVAMGPVPPGQWRYLLPFERF